VAPRSPPGGLTTPCFPEDGVRPDGKFAGISKQLNMPPDFVFVNRIQWGVYSILAQLGATGNWHKIHREYLYCAPPSTALGQARVCVSCRPRGGPRSAGPTRERRDGKT
jgi:hypothetical protein